MSAMTIELHPPRWWKAGRIVFYVFGALNAMMGLSIVALVIWLAQGGNALELATLPTLSLGIFIAAMGVFLVLQVRRTGGYRAMPLVLEDGHALLPRLRTNETVCVAYEDFRKILLMRIPALRMRVFVRTARGDFFVHRSWLPQGWTLEKLAGELARRRDAAKAPPP